MKKELLFLLLACCMIACQESLEKRAAREASEYTRKNCPSAIKNNIRTDSLAFDEASRTIIYYYSLFNTLDDSAFMVNHKEEMISKLNDALKQDISLKSYKEASFNIRYEYHSSTSPKLILLEKTFTPEDYSNWKRETWNIILGIPIKYFKDFLYAKNSSCKGTMSW